MTDLTAFASMPLDQLTAELERMLINHDTPRRAYAARTLSTLATSGEITPLPCTNPVVTSTPYPAESQA